MKEQFIKALKERTGKEVMAKEMEKGLGISIVGEANVPTPVFYWEHIEPIVKEKGIDHVVDMYIDFLEKAKKNLEIPELTAEYVKENVHRYIRGVTDNGKIVKSVVFGAYEIYYVVTINESNEQRAFTKLTYNLIESIGLTPAEIAEAANKNDFEQLELMNMGEMFGADLVPMWVVTNKAKGHGAGVVFAEDVVEKITEKIGDFVVLPSSVHEVIVIPLENANHEMVEMVKEINRTTVADEDILGNTILKCVDGIFEIFE